MVEWAALCLNSPGKNLSRIHDVVRVQRMFDLAHEVDRRATQFIQQKTLFVQTHAMFTSAGAVHRQGARYQPGIEVFGLLYFGP